MQNPHVPAAGDAAAPMQPPAVTRVRIPTRVQPHSRIAPEAGAQAAATAGSSTPGTSTPVAAASVSSSRSASTATPTPPPTAAAVPVMVRETSAQSAASATGVALTPTPTPAADEFPPPPTDPPTRYVAVTLPPAPVHAAAPFAAAAAASPQAAPDPPVAIEPPPVAASAASNAITLSSDDEMGDVDDDEAGSTAPSAALAAASSVYDSLDRCFCSDPNGLHDDLVCSQYDDRPWLSKGGVKCFTTHARCVKTAEGLPFRGYAMGTSAFLCRACITRPGFTPPNPAALNCTFNSDAGHFYDIIAPTDMQQPQQQPHPQQQQGEADMETESAQAAAATATAAAAMPSTPHRPPSSVARSTTDKPLPSPPAPPPRAPSSAAAASVSSSSAASKFGSGALIDLSGDADEIFDLTTATADDVAAAAVSKPARAKRAAASAAVPSSGGLFTKVTLPFKIRKLRLRLDGAILLLPRRLDAAPTETDEIARVRQFPWKPPGPRSSRIRDRQEREVMLQAHAELDASMDAATESDEDDEQRGARRRTDLTKPVHSPALSKKTATAKPRASALSSDAAASSSSAAAIAAPAPSIPAIQHSVSASGRPIFWCRCDCKQRCAHMHAEHAKVAGLASTESSFESMLRPLFERDCAAGASSSDASSVTELRSLGSTLLPGLVSLFESTGVSVSELGRMSPVLLHKCLCQVAHAHSTATYSVLLRHFPSPTALLPRSHS